MRPDFSASISILTPMRSFTEPPGFMNSHFAEQLARRSRPMRARRTIGVSPVASRITSSPTARSGARHADDSDCNFADSDDRKSALRASQ